MKITIDLPVERCGDDTCDSCGVDLTDAEILINDAQTDYKQFCFELGEYVMQQLHGVSDK